MKHFILILAALTASLLCGLQYATAGVLIDDTGAWNGSSSIGTFAHGAWATIGETISVPSTGYSVLEDFSFEVDTPAALVFRAEVFGWNGSEASGPNLFESAPTHTTGSFEGDFQLTTFNTGGIQLNASQQYVIFLSISKDYSADANVFIPGTLGGGFNLNYDGGQAVLSSSFGDPSKWTSQPWDFTFPATFDLAFKAEFDPPPAPAVAEPTSLTLFGTMLSGLVFFGCRKRHRLRLSGG